MTAFSNYPTMLQTNKSSSSTLIQNGNLYMPGAAYDSTAIGSVGVSSGKWYYELRVGHNYGSYFVFGWVCANIDYTYLTEISTSQTSTLNWSQLGSVVINGSYIAPDPSVPKYYNTNTKIVGTYLDLDNNKVYWHGDNNFLQQTDGTARTPTAGNGFDIPTSLQGQIFYPMVGTNKTGAPSNTHVNFGQDSSFQGETTGQNNTDSNGFGDFYYAPATGYLSMCSSNMPTSSDIDPAQTDNDIPSKQFGVVTYTGNGTARSFTGLGFSPDMVFIKMRQSGDNGKITDSVRGVQTALIANTTAVESTDTNGVTAFGTDGFSIGSGNQYNLNEYNFVAWCWRAGGTASNNTDGTTTVSLSANPNAGFSIGTWTGTSSSKTLGHGLTKAPEFMMVKSRSNVYQWLCYHKDAIYSGVDAQRSYLELNTDSAVGTHNGIWDSTAPTNSLVHVGNANGTNGSGRTYVGYFWHSVEGYTKFSSYIGNGSTDGPFIQLGFRPRMLFIKRTDSAASWYVLDTERGTYNPITTLLAWDLTSSESAIGSANNFDVLSNGLKIRTSGGGLNASGGKFVYGAWGDIPAKYPNTF